MIIMAIFLCVLLAMSMHPWCWINERKKRERKKRRINIELRFLLICCFFPIRATGRRRGFSLFTFFKFGFFFEFTFSCFAFFCKSLRFLVVTSFFKNIAQLKNNDYLTSLQNYFFFYWVKIQSWLSLQIFFSFIF